MMEFEYIGNDRYKFNEKEISADKLAELIKDGTIVGILETCNEDGKKSFCIENKLVDLPKYQLAQNMQVIYFGVPGTGKSYSISQKIKEYYPDYDEKLNINKNVFRTTIHSEYSYFDFVGNILPVSKNNIIDYRFVPGIFTLALYRAYTDNKPVFLVLEEMSRGNIAAIFGDLFQLLDRDHKGNSDYSINHQIICDYIKKTSEVENIQIRPSILNVLENGTIYLPHNLHILGSINTSDQNVFVLDNAFKRRFQMKYISLKPIVKNGELLNNEEIKIGSHSIKWCDFFPVLNKFIVKNMGHNEDKQIGQFFLKFKDESMFNLENYAETEKEDIKKYIKEWNESQVLDKLLLYLWQDIEKASFNNSKIFNREIVSFSDLSDLIEEYRSSETVTRNKEVFSEEFLEMLSKAGN